MTVPVSFLFAGGVGDAAHEEDAAGRVVADQEDEGMVSLEHRVHADRFGGHFDGGGGGGFGAFFVHFDEGLVLDLRDP